MKVKTMSKLKVLAEFTVLGDPRIFALRRPRARSVGLHARVHEHPENLSAKDCVRAAATRQSPPPLEPVETPLELTVRAFFPVPQSWSKKQRKRALAGERAHVSKPDCSNIVKLVEDALEDIYYRNDSQFVQVVMSKCYSARPRLEVLIGQYVGDGQ